MQQTIHSHQFTDANGAPEGGQTFAPGLSIAWQRGPLGRDENRKEPNGCFVETVIAAALDRLEFYQRSKFASSEYNATAITHLNDALAALQARTAAREARKVEGTHEV
jgi:hypothetical protein